MSQIPPPLPEDDKPKPLGDDLGMRVLLPVGRSGYAIAAGYLGLISILILPAPLALVFGILGIRDIRHSQSGEHKKYGMGRAIFGVVMGGLGTGLLLLLLANYFAG